MFDVPWDDPMNRKVAAWPAQPFCFASADAPPEKRCMTNILAVSGPDTAFVPGKGRRLSDLDTDTILIVETNDSNIHWMEPGDLDVSKMPDDVDECSAIGISGTSPGGFFVGFADGEVWKLRNDTPLSTLRKFFTVSGSKSHNRDKLLAEYRLQ